MKKRIVGCWLIMALLGLAGCVTPIYQVQINGYTDPSAPTALIPGAAFFIMENQEAKNPLLEKEMALKIAGLLNKQGYQISTFEQATYYLLFSYGLGPAQNVSVTLSDYYPYDWGFTLGTAPRRASPYFFVAPFWASYPYAETIYDRWLLINVVDGKTYRDKKKFLTLWVGEARSTGASADLRVAINYLLVAAFDQFGKNTGKAVPVDLNEEDIRVKELAK
jgi:hypothetical protein